MDEKNEQTRVRMAYKVNAKGKIQPDVTAEAETVETAKKLLIDGLAAVKEVAASEGTLE